jgi:aspartyl-tRNA(Asn)/glutamyl-tRNA(Gln) amidotransferase subunit A
MRVIAGEDANDPTSAKVAVPDYEAALVGDLRGVRIAVPRTYYYDHVSAEVEQCLRQALSVLRARGATLVDTKAPDMVLINSMMHLVMASEAATIHRNWLLQRPQDYAPQVRQRIEPGLYYPATRYLEALSLRAGFAQEWLSAVMGDADLAFLPTVSIAVPSIEETTAGDPAAVAAKIGVITHCTRGINYLGLPAASVPAGFAQDRPVGFQLVGRPFAEAAILRAADAYQRDTDWHAAAPPVVA